VVAAPKDVSIPISLTVNVTDITDTQKLREILRAIREELLERKETESQD
jgi:small-conductance mechanosensitive channel